MVTSMVAGAKRRFGVAAAEVGFQDQRQRAAARLRGGGVDARATPREVMDEVDRFVWSHPEVEVLSTERRWLE